MVDRYPPGVSSLPRSPKRLAQLLLWICLVCLAPQGWAQDDHPVDLRTTSSLPSDFLLGLEAAHAISRYYGLVEVDSVLNRINHVGYSVAASAGRPEILFTFQVLDIDEPNAMALPGGWIFLTRGILEIGLSDAELAHLIGHEIIHVSRSHFSRQGRLNTLLSVLQTAAVVMVAIGESHSDSNHSPVIESPGSYDVPQSSMDAALTGTAIFGSVFQELLLRGYGRKLEMESDDDGRRLAALAGYPREASASLLQKLHDRIYEGREYGYWRTHPYFTDRVSAARAAGSGADHAPLASTIDAYRTHIQEGLANAASKFVDEEVAGFLYELALRAGPGGGSNLAVHSQLLGFRLERIHRRSPILRPYEPLRTDYDSLLVQGRRAGADEETLDRIEARRNSIEEERLALLPLYLDAIRQQNPSTQVLEHFAGNFPNHELTPSIRLQIARAYRLSGRNALAASALGELLHGSPIVAGASDSTDAMRALAELKRVLPLVEDPDVCQQIYQDSADREIKMLLLDRLSAIAGSLSSLEVVGRFVQTYPASPVIEVFKERLLLLAGQELKKGRLHEAMGDRQGALEIYNRLVILAHGTDPALEARRGISRIQSLAESDSGD